MKKVTLFCLAAALLVYLLVSRFRLSDELQSCKEQVRETLAEQQRLRGVIRDYAVQLEAAQPVESRGDR